MTQASIDPTKLSAVEQYDLIAAQDRVNRGVEALDKHMPGWHERINTNKLDISCCVQCVLGQLFGNYFSSPLKKLLGLNQDSQTVDGIVPILTINAGFNLPRPFRASYLEKLNAEWIRAIHEKSSHKEIAD